MWKEHFRNLLGNSPKVTDELITKIIKNQFDDSQLRYCNAVYKQNIIETWTKVHFPKKGDLRIAKNYRGLTLRSIADKINNALLINCIEQEIEKILTKNQNGFRRNWSSTSQILTIHRIVERVGIKQKPEKRGENLIRWFLHGIWLHTQREYWANNLAYGLLKEANPNPKKLS